jgi:hypothetical protein
VVEEADYFRILLQLSKIPRFTTLQKFADRIIINNDMMLGKIIISFVVLTGTRRRHIFVGIDSPVFNITRTSQYHAERVKLRRRKYAKLSIGANVLKQIICNIKVRRAPTRHDNIDFKPVITPRHLKFFRYLLL